MANKKGTMKRNQEDIVAYIRNYEDYVLDGIIETWTEDLAYNLYKDEGYKGLDIAILGNLYGTLTGIIRCNWTEESTMKVKVVYIKKANRGSKYPRYEFIKRRVEVTDKYDIAGLGSEEYANFLVYYVDRVKHDVEAVSLLESLGTKWYELFDGLVSFEELLSDYL